MATPILSQVCRANMLILGQKQALIDALLSRHASPQKAREMFQSICPMVGSSVGMHLRHSMDHIENASLAAHDAYVSPSNHTYSEIHYDLRTRGGVDESNIDEARKRIIRVQDILEEVKHQCDLILERDLSALHQDALHGKHPVQAYFFLSGVAGSPEVGLSSTVARELGFAAHHAIHHLAIVKIIALNHAGLQESDLPMGFGRAPSTVRSIADFILI